MSQSKEYYKAWYEANKEKKLAKSKAWRDANPEKCLGYSRTEKRKAQRKAWAQTHNRKTKQKPPTKEKAREYAQRWVSKNREAANALWRHHQAIRAAKKLRATPEWSDKKVIASIYALARAYRAAGIEVHVDHIVPLRSKVVCGLHVEANLQLLPGSENSRKSNRFWPDMP